MEENNDSSSKVWFAAKKYGIGWGLPAAWQGWVVLIIYLVLIFAGLAVVTRFSAGIIPFVLYVMLLSALLVFICWKKGEKPEWRWGDKK